MNNDVSDSVFDLAEWRERFIHAILRLAAILGIVLIALSFPTASLTDRILFPSLYLALVAITILPTPYALRAYLLLALTAAVGINGILAWGPWSDGSIFLLASVILSALLLDRKSAIAFLVATIAFLSLVAFFNGSGAYPLAAPAAPQTRLVDWGAYIADFSVLGVVFLTAINMLKNTFEKTASQVKSAFQSLMAERQTLEDKVRENAAELEAHMAHVRASTSAARAIAETQEITATLKQSAELISEQFEYYHVGIYILDDQGRTAYLQTASSETGKSLIGQAFHIEHDRKNPLSLVAERKQTVITTDLDKTHYYRDENFPLTRSRMALPLAVRGFLIGILDIHSDQPRAFTPEDAEILQTLANLTAISFDNARLLEETRRLLSQLEASSAYQTQKTWSKFTSRQKNAYQYTPVGVRPVFSREKTLEEGLNVPIVLQGQSIGRIRLKRKGAAMQWSSRERELVNKIASQVALALENSRLVDEAQKNAHRNQMIANFSTQVRETLDVESVVRNAATELRKVFDLREAEILIGYAQTGASPQSAP